jgi:phage gp29-like protein
MLYDPQGRPIPEAPAVAPATGRTCIAEPADRRDPDVSRGLTPTKVDAILTAANSGDLADQSRLAFELEEKNWDISQAIQTRRLAVLGIPWTIEPGDDTPAAAKAAELLAAELAATGHPNEGIDSFSELLNDLLSALLPGFAVSEIVWGPGGTILGFAYIDQRHLSFRDSLSTPRLITRDAPQGIELPPRKLVIHRLRRRGPDVARAGLIRPLAWLHCFANINIKDLLSFIERYGMPFVVAKVDQESWTTERNVLRSLIRNFGPSGGGLFTKAMEIELLQAANNTGDVYFKLLDYLAQAITKVVLGQLGTSGEGGWSNNGAQSQVRQDILEGDCTALATTVNSQLVAVWAEFRLADGVAAPVFTFHSEPPENTKSLAETLSQLNTAGLEADAEEMSNRFGFKLTRRPQLPASMPFSSRSLPLAAEELDTDVLADAAAAEFEASGRADKWGAKFAGRLAEFAISEDDDDDILDQFDKFPGDFLDDFDSSHLAKAGEDTSYAAAATGMADSAQRIRTARPTQVGRQRRVSLR